MEEIRNALFLPYTFVFVAIIFVFVDKQAFSLTSYMQDVIYK